MSDRGSSAPSAELVRQFLAGACTGVVTKTLTAPAERVKIVMQVAKGQGAGHLASGGNNFRGIGDTVSFIWRSGGFVGFYCGNGANVLRVIPVHSLKFGGNDFFKRVFVDDKKPTTGQRMLAGTCAGLLQQTLTMPLEVVRTRLSLGAAMNPPLQYRGILGCAGTIVRMEGWMGLYKGLVATLWSGVPFVALQMTLFGTLSDYLPKQWYGVMLAGGIAGIGAQVITYPGDTVRKLMILNGANGTVAVYKSSMDCCQQVLAKQGFRGFYGGLGANVIRAVPEASLQFLVYEKLKGLLVSTS